MSSDEAEIDLDVYINEIRNTIHAAYEEGHAREDVHGEVESLFFELREEYDPTIDTPEAFADELDGLTRNAYVRTDEVIEVLGEKIDELEAIGEKADEWDEELMPAPEDGEGPD